MYLTSLSTSYPQKKEPSCLASPLSTSTAVCARSQTARSYGLGHINAGDRRRLRSTAVRRTRLLLSLVVVGVRAQWSCFQPIREASACAWPCSAAAYVCVSVLYKYVLWLREWGQHASKPVRAVRGNIDSWYVPNRMNSLKDVEWDDRPGDMWYRQSAARSDTEYRSSSPNQTVVSHHSILKYRISSCYFNPRENMIWDLIWDCNWDLKKISDEIYMRSHMRSHMKSYYVFQTLDLMWDLIWDLICYFLLNKILSQ